MLTKTKLAIAVAALGLGFATSSFARLSADENLGVQVLDQSSTQELDVVARRGRGADDAPGHIRREDRRAYRRQS